MNEFIWHDEKHIPNKAVLIASQLVIPNLYYWHKF